MPSPIQPLKGTRDFYPADVARRNAMLNPVRKTLETYGYEPYEAPILEPLALYAAKSSTEIIERQSYVFDDRGSERLVLRPEMTPSLARLVAARQRELPNILRWYSFPDCWRYERPQKGRLRNFLQINADLIGSDTAEADIEILDLALTMTASIGADMNKIELRLNDRRLLESWLTACGYETAQWPNILTVLDNRDKMEPEAFMTELVKLGSQEQAKRMVGFLEQPIDQILTGAERLREVVEGLKRLGWENNVRVDPTIIRGFLYYTGVVFEVYETSGAFRRAVFGGGRYDNLVQAVGGSPVSGIGFGVSDVSLEQALAAQGTTFSPAPANRTAVIPYSAGEDSFTRECITALRSRGLVAERALPPYDLKKQLTLATKRGASWAALIFPDEAARGHVALKNLGSGEQETLSLPEAVEKIAQTR